MTLILRRIWSTRQPGRSEGNHSTTTKRPTADISPRKIALIAGVGLLFIAPLTPFAQFGVLQSLVVPANATATVDKIIASEGLFRSGVAA